MRRAHIIDRINHSRCAEQSVFTKAHRRCTCVTLLARHRHLIPTHALNAGDNTDHFCFIFKDWALLDVKFKHRRELNGPGLMLALIANALQLIAELDALAVFAGICKLWREHACVNARTQHGGSKARTFFIGPIHNHDGRIGFITHINQSAQRL